MNTAQSTQPREDDLSQELDRILERTFSDLKKRLYTAISRREKRFLKQINIAQKTSRAPTRAPARVPVPSVKEHVKKHSSRHSNRKSKKYHSSSSETGDSLSD